MSGMSPVGVPDVGGGGWRRDMARGAGGPDLVWLGKRGRDREMGAERSTGCGGQVREIGARLGRWPTRNWIAYTRVGGGMAAWLHPGLVEIDSGLHH